MNRTEVDYQGCITGINRDFSPCTQKSPLGAPLSEMLPDCSCKYNFAISKNWLTIATVLIIDANTDIITQIVNGS